MADAPPADGLFSFLKLQPKACFVLGVLPALLIGSVTVLGGDAAAQLTDDLSFAQRLEGLGVVALQLAVQLFAIVLLAVPVAGMVGGRDLPRAVGLLRKRAAWGMAGRAALLIAFALLLPLLPGLLASYINPLMSLIFLIVGTIGGAALAVGLFGRWMHAPALVAEGAGALDSLARAREESRSERNFGAALGMSVAFVFILGAGTLGATLAALAFPNAADAARIVGMTLVLAPLLPLVPARAAQRHLAHTGRGPGTPTLALRARPSRCPRCGALAQVPTGGGAVTCPGCGLVAAVR